VVIGFVDIGRIVDHNCLNFLFIITTASKIQVLPYYNVCDSKSSIISEKTL
jgi:hypothetical protein